MISRLRPILIFLTAVVLGLGVIVVLQAALQGWLYRPLCTRYLITVEGEDAGRFAFRSFDSSIRPARYTCTFARRDTGQLTVRVVQPHEPGRAGMLIASVAEVISYVVIYGVILSVALGFATRYTP